MVEGARLESVYTATYRGFESLTLRHYYASLSRSTDFSRLNCFKPSFNLSMAKAGSATISPLPVAKIIPPGLSGIQSTKTCLSRE